MFRSFYAAVLAAIVLVMSVAFPVNAVADGLGKSHTLVLVQFSAHLDDSLDDVKRGLESLAGNSSLEIVITREGEMTVLLKSKGGNLLKSEISKALANEWVSLNAIANVQSDLKAASARLQQYAAVDSTVIYIVPASVTIRGTPPLPANLAAPNTRIVVIQLTTPERGAHYCHAYEMVWNWKAGSVYMMIPAQELGGVLKSLTRK